MKNGFKPSWTCVVAALLLVCVLYPRASAQSDPENNDDPPAEIAPETVAPGNTKPEDSRITLGAASVCQAVQNGIPRNEAVVFSITLSRVYCFTDFQVVPRRTFIYHHWFFADQKRASVKLLVRPPRWSTYSSLQLRATDVGPWRVDITTEDGRVLRTLRFSILE